MQTTERRRGMRWTLPHDVPGLGRAGDVAVALLVRWDSGMPRTTPQAEECGLIGAWLFDVAKPVPGRLVRVGYKVVTVQFEDRVLEYYRWQWEQKCYLELAQIIEVIPGTDHGWLDDAEFVEAMRRVMA